eukprot:c5269_g1_i1.p1 GENE.c5269_g1_i1~~c5269_g1_i1.p1  ORF type:complete len:273 (+),score=39.79 c5269_g1_i1:832-1650(+)
MKLKVVAIVEVVFGSFMVLFFVFLFVIARLNSSDVCAVFSAETYIRGFGGLCSLVGGIIVLANFGNFSSNDFLQKFGGNNNSVHRSVTAAIALISFSIGITRFKIKETPTEKLENASLRPDFDKEEAERILLECVNPRKAKMFSQVLAFAAWYPGEVERKIPNTFSFVDIKEYLRAKFKYEFKPNSHVVYEFPDIDDLRDVVRALVRCGRLKETKELQSSADSADTPEFGRYEWVEYSDAPTGGGSGSSESGAASDEESGSESDSGSGEASS